MKTIEEVLNNYDEYQTTMEDRFGKRFCLFLPTEQIEKLGFKLKEGYEHKPLEWTLENILAQLKEDAEFGLEKAEGERGISASLMYEVCRSWCKIIGKENLIKKYIFYGISTFKNILKYIEDQEKGN